MSTAPDLRRLRHRRPRRLRHLLVETGALALAAGLVVWSLLPVYNMMLIALDPEGDTEFSGTIWPDEPSFSSFRAVWSEGYWYLEHFWQQFGNSLYVGLATMALTLLVGSLASFAAGRMRFGKARWLANAGLLVYALPASFLAIPFIRVVHGYGLSDSLWAVIAAEVAFASPFAMFVLQQYGRLIPLELDEAARVDGASPFQVYLRIYLPLMAPALAAVGTFALLLAWGDYMYQYLLLTSSRHWTVAVAIEQFFDSDEAPWNYMMAACIVYAVPPIAFFFALGRYISAGLTFGAIKR